MEEFIQVRLHGVGSDVDEDGPAAPVGEGISHVLKTFGSPGDEVAAPAFLEGDAVADALMGGDASKAPPGIRGEVRSTEWAGPGFLDQS